MSTMMLSSTTFRLLSPKYTCITRPRYVSQYLLLVVAFSPIMTVLSGSEAVCFVSLCLFEACVGVYNPMMASIKGQIVPNEHRSKVYGLLRVPTNTFVDIALLSVKTGDNNIPQEASPSLTFIAGNMYRSTSLMISSVLLILGSVVTTLVWEIK
jgi:MFS transporter, MFS domain-containing protein family, molybdate-anion transporter